jgi:hypothetical protein
MTEAIHMTEVEQIEMAHAMLDNAGIPRSEGDRELSLVARVSRLANPWRPIETAPKDGRWMLIYDSAGPGPKRDDDDYPDWPPVMTARWERENGWTGEGRIWPEDPTHWMPIPEVTR